MVGAVIAALFAFLVGIPSVFGIILLAAAVVLFTTAVVGFCPLYRILGIRSN